MFIYKRTVYNNQNLQQITEQNNFCIQIPFWVHATYSILFFRQFGLKTTRKNSSKIQTSGEQAPDYTV